MDDYSRFLDDPPVSGKRLLELSLTWKRLPGARARMADLLRVFVITWDPLELDGDRPSAFATANSDEVCLYVTSWSLPELAERRGTDTTEVLGWLGGRVVATAAEHERDVIAGRYAQLVASGEKPDLLQDASEEAPFGRTAEIQVESEGWDPIGLGAITDIVQQAYGPVDLDRSLVELIAAPDRTPGCPACEGERFNFPADLNEQSAYMCEPHQKAAKRVTRERLLRAEKSNGPGWNAMTDASTRLQLPLVPNGLVPEIRAQIGAPGPELLRLLTQAWTTFDGQPEEFYAVIGSEPEGRGRLPQPPRWMQTLVRDLADAGHYREALDAAEQLSNFESLWSDHWADDSLVAIAAAVPSGAIDDDKIRFQIEFVRSLCPKSASVLMHIGDIYAALNKTEGALDSYKEAKTLAIATGDFEIRRTAESRVAGLSRTGTERQVVRVQRRVQPRRKRR